MAVVLRRLGKPRRVVYAIVVKKYALNLMAFGQGRHHELPAQPGDDPSLPKYIEFLKAQVRELCTNYGEIHGFWWDMNVDKHVDRSINALIRQLQPKAVINDRGYDEGDFGTPERD